MSFANRVAECQLRLTPADLALVALIEADPIAAGLRSASDLAGRAGVHGATAGRFAKKLGFSNWRTLQDALRHEHIQRSGMRPSEPTAAAGTLDGTVSLSPFTDGIACREKMGPAVLQEPLQAGRSPAATPESAPSMLSWMADRTTALIKATDELGLDLTAEAAARRLCEAAVVWIAARGDYAAIGLLLRIRLRRCNVDARLLADDEVDRLAAASPGDVLLEVAGDAPRFRFEGLRRCAAARGLTVVLIGPLVTSANDPPPDVHIAVPSGKTGDAVLVAHVLGAVTMASTVVTMRPRAFPS